VTQKSHTAALSDSDELLNRFIEANEWNRIRWIALHPNPQTNRSSRLDWIIRAWMHRECVQRETAWTSNPASVCLTHWTHGPAVVSLFM